MFTTFSCIRCAWGLLQLIVVCIRPKSSQFKSKTKPKSFPISMPTCLRNSSLSTTTTTSISCHWFIRSPLICVHFIPNPRYANDVYCCVQCNRLDVYASVCMVEDGMASVAMGGDREEGGRPVRPLKRWWTPPVHRFDTRALHHHPPAKKRR